MRSGERRFLRVFALASFLNDFGSDMIYPVWPMFVTRIMQANMVILGFIDGLGEAIVSISQAASGYASDKTGKRKVFVWIGYLFGSLSRIGYALSTVWEHLIPFKIMDRAGKMRGAPRDAIIADISEKENRGKNFGILRTMDNLGAVCGIVACILLFGLLGYQNLFLFAAIPSLVSIVLVRILINETKSPQTMIHKGFKLRDLDWNFKLFVFLSSVFALGSFSYSFLLEFAWQSGFEQTFVPVLYLIFTAFASFSSLPFGRLSDKLGRKQMLMLSYVLWGLVCASFLLQSHWSILLAFVLYGLHKGALDPVQRTLVSELVPVNYRASGLGTFQMIIGLCALPSSLIAGFLWMIFGLAAPFLFSLILVVLSMVMLAFVNEK